MSARFTPPTYEAIPSVDQMVTSMDRTVSGLEQIKRRLALALRRFMVAAAKDHDRPPQNIIVIGPSGGGKTFLLRQLLSSIPVIWTDVDATAFSDVGYVGRDLSSMYLGLMSPKWRGARGQAEPPYLSPEMVSLASRWGVMVLDEADKLRAPARPKEGERQVGRALQAELLKLVEGVDTMVKRTDDERGVMLPTHNILHIAVGAFQGLDSIVVRDGVLAHDRDASEARALGQMPRQVQACSDSKFALRIAASLAADAVEVHGSFEGRVALLLDRDIG